MQTRQLIADIKFKWEDLPIKMSLLREMPRVPRTPEEYLKEVSDNPEWAEKVTEVLLPYVNTKLRYSSEIAIMMYEMDSARLKVLQP